MGKPGPYILMTFIAASSSGVNSPRGETSLPIWPVLVYLRPSCNHKPIR